MQAGLRFNGLVMVYQPEGRPQETAAFWYLDKPYIYSRL